MLKVLLVDETPPGSSGLRQALEAVDGPDAVLIGAETLASILRELEEVKSRLEERKLVDRAKGILMKQRGTGEDEAFALLRSLSMQRGIRLGEAARQVIDVASLLG